MIQQVRKETLIIKVILLCHTAASVQFSRGTYSGTEASGFVNVDVILTGGTSASPFNVTVTPSEQSPVSAEGNIVCIIIMC